MNRPVLTRENSLVVHLCGLSQRPIASHTRERLAQAFLDWFTAGWSGATATCAENYRRVAGDCHPGAGDAPVFGGAQMNANGAAFANAAIAHIREIDDAHRAAMLHPGVVSVTPVLALAASAGMTQRQVADAVIAGYEVSLRLGEALGTRHAAGFHATATAGAVGAAAASGVAMGLTPAMLHHALGIGATQAAGLWQLVDDDAHEAKSLHPAFAVRNGMAAAYAARAGLPGAQRFATGSRGLYRLLAGDGPLDALDGGLDAPERVNTATIKAWPCCAQLFTPLDATRELMDQHAPAPDEIESIDVEIFTHALKIAGVEWPAKPAETCFSLRYVVARLLLAGKLGIEDMESPDLHAPGLLALARRITVRTSEVFQQEFPRLRPCRVTLTLKDGRQWSALRKLRKGDPEDPYNWASLQARMRAFAPAMDDAAARAIVAWCERFTDAGQDADICLPAPGLFGAAPHS
ncbi:MmgE/PrpD family protein [Achromobacter marplatensis]|uniref:MmgE/PrpD family protein n=1 Tax=Achromobacter marplatensis TaxID=470868 RepID=A0AA42WA06_9BURK|nr:MmgE/PrpD family protein [Achromobacter marplatensis]MDH2049794.1 MmgE/PrpD family protein [Achromobacter marplatensis]